MADRDVESRVRVTKEGDPEAIRDLERDLDSVGEAAKTTTSDLDRAGRELGQTEQSARSAASDVDHLEREIEELRAALRQAVSQLDRFERQSKAAGNASERQAAQMSRLKTIVAGLGFVGLLEILRQTVGATERQRRSFEQLERAVESTGGVAGITAKELAEIADSLQAVTNHGDEAIEEMEGVLLTFTNLGKDILPEVAERVLDVSDRMQTGLIPTANQLGKALNAPTQNLGALSRVGIQFTESQREVIRSLEESGDLAGAQAIILEELERQFGGTARGARDASLGVDALKNSAGDLLEEIGEGGLGAAIKAITADLQELGEEGGEAGRTLGRGLGTAILAIKGLVQGLEVGFQLVARAIQGGVGLALREVAVLGENIARLFDAVGFEDRAQAIRQQLQPVADAAREIFEDARVDLEAELREGRDNLSKTWDQIVALYSEGAEGIEEASKRAVAAGAQLGDGLEAGGTKGAAAASKLESDVKRFLSGVPGAITQTAAEVEEKGNVLAAALEKIGGAQGFRLLPDEGRAKLKEDVQTFVDAAKELGEKIDPELAAVANAIGVLVPPWAQAAAGTKEGADQVAGAAADMAGQVEESAGRVAAAGEKVTLSFDSQGQAILSNVQAAEQAAEAAGKVKTSLDEQGQALISNIDAADKAAQAGEKVTLSYDEQGQAILSNLEAVEDAQSKVGGLAEETERLADAAGQSQAPLEAQAETLRGIANIEGPGVKILREELEQLGVTDLSVLSGSLEEIKAKLADIRAEAQAVVVDLNAIDSAGGGGAPVSQAALTDTVS